MVEPTCNADYWDEPDDWEPSDENLSETECCRCEKVAICKLTRDPYIDELYPEDKPEPEHWCYPCWSLRHDDI